MLLVDRPVLHQHIEKSAVARVVFLIDGTTFKQQLREVAEYLYDILVSAKLRKNRVPLLIAVHKADDASCVPTDTVQSLLTTELEKLRTTKASMSDTADTSSVPLCPEGTAFRFETQPMRISFARTSARTDDGLDPLVAFAC